MPVSGRKNLVLGGKGSIGSDLCALLKERGEEVAILDRKAGHDLRKAESYFDQFKWADRVWFLAWDVGIWKHATAPAYQSDILDSNLQLCRSVFRCLERLGKPFLFVTSHLAAGMNTLGVTKRVGEMWTKILGGHIARLWNVYCWEPPGEKSHVIPDLIWMALQGKIELMTNGEETRQFLYVRDCTEALAHQFDIGQKYADITSDQDISIKTLAQLIGDKLGAEVVFGSKPGSHSSLSSPEVFLKSWKPRFSLDMGLGEIINKAKVWHQTL